MMEEDIRPEDYGYDSEAIAEQARENLKRNRPYQKIYEQLDRLDPRRDFVKRNYLLTQARLMEENEIKRLMDLTNKRRQDVRRIGDYLEQHNPEDSEKYETLMAGFAFLLDMIDFTLHDINEILFRRQRKCQAATSRRCPNGSAICGCTRATACSITSRRALPTISGEPSGKRRNVSKSS